MNAVVSALLGFDAGLLFRLVAEVLGPVDFPDDRELPRLGAPFLTVMASTVVASTTLFTAAPRNGRLIIEASSVRIYKLMRVTEESSPEKSN